MGTITLEVKEGADLDEGAVLQLFEGGASDRILELLRALTRRNDITIVEVDTKRNMGPHAPFPKVRIRLSHDVSGLDATTVARKLIEEYPEYLTSAG